MSNGNNSVDLEAVRELENMARVYERRGNIDKACELLELAGRMMRRLNAEQAIELNKPLDDNKKIS